MKCVGVALCCLASSVFGQQNIVPPAPSAISAANPGAPGSVTLHVVVTTRKGKPVAGLQQQDIAVQVDKKPQPILTFQAVEATATTAAPIDTILLIDTVNTRFTHVAYEREQIERFLRQNDGKLAQPTSLVVLTDTGVSITPQSTRDGNQLAAFLDQAESTLRLVGRAEGFYGWIEQFQISTRALHQIAAYETNRPGRKLLIWISPGWPLLSGPEVDLTPNQQTGLFADAVAFSHELRNARITLTSVDPLGTDDLLGYRTTFYQEFTKGIATPGQMQFGNLALQVLATQSGGRVLNSNNDVAKLITDAASDAETFYTITITPPPAEHKDQYRYINLTVDRPGLAAHTLTGYYDQP